MFCMVPATWGGAKLSDVLELVGIPKLSSVTSLGGKHVEFVSVDKCKVSVLILIDWQSLLWQSLPASVLLFVSLCQEEKGGPYTASIPLNQATNPDADVLLAYEMNGEVDRR
jgi:sulfite oxidase